jgi:hypothetical protein
VPQQRRCLGTQFRMRSGPDLYPTSLRSLS